MKRLLFAGLALGALAILAPVPALAGGGTWVSADGETVQCGGDGVNAFFSEDEGFDLADLADGETRMFGSGEDRISVSRTGDEATIRRADAGAEGEISVTCRLSTDSCRVVTPDKDGGHVMIVVKKQRRCVDGEGDCEDVLVDDLSGVGPHAIAITEVIECKDGADCIETELTASGDHHGIITLDAAAGAVAIGEGKSGTVMFIRQDDKVTLQCPEGDTRMEVEPEEADDVYLCPKHAQPLEKVEPKLHRIRRVRVNKGEDEPQQH